jgi:hypothetical protein
MAATSGKPSGLVAEVKVEVNRSGGNGGKREEKSLKEISGSEAGVSDGPMRWRRGCGGTSGEGDGGVGGGEGGLGDVVFFLLLGTDCLRLGGWG